MNFSFTEDQIRLKESVIDFAKNNLPQSYIIQDHNCMFSMDDWKKCADFGIQSMSVSHTYGNGKFKSDIDLLAATIAMEGLGYGCPDNGLLLALNAQMWTVQLPIEYFGTKEQKIEYLKPLTLGDSIACHALTEENAGSDVFSMQTTATKVEGGYMLNGKKCMISLAPVADFALVFANSNPKIGKWGVTAFLVKKGTKGFSISENKTKMGMRTVPFGELMFKNCFVPDKDRLGKEGAGWSITNHSLENDRCSVFAAKLGAMERQLEKSIEYVKTRKQFGKKISEFQSVSNRIAEMKLRLETSKLLLYKTAWLKNQGKSAMLEAAMLKLQVSENFVSSSLDTIRNHGAIGYLTENEIERDLRDSVGGLIYAGTSDIQKNIIAKLLGL